MTQNERGKYDNFVSGCNGQVSNVKLKVFNAQLM